MKSFTHMTRFLILSLFLLTINSKAITCNPNLSKKNNWAFCAKMAYGPNMKMTYRWKAK